MYTTHKLCAHVIVVAEVHSKLEELIEYRFTGNMDPSIFYGHDWNAMHIREKNQEQRGQGLRNKVLQK